MGRTIPTFPPMDSIVQQPQVILCLHGGADQPRSGPWNRGRGSNRSRTGSYRGRPRSPRGSRSGSQGTSSGGHVLNLPIPTRPGHLAIRGYYSLIRPGVESILCNVNTATSVFHRPVLVSDFTEAVEFMKGNSYNLKQIRNLEVSLRNVLVRITHTLPSNYRGGPDNADGFRLRTIAELGVAVELQDLYLEGDSTPRLLLDHYRGKQK